MDQNSGVSMAPAYVSYSTFSNAMGSLRDGGVPSHIDRSIFPSVSGGSVTALLASFRFLGLITPDNRPTDVLKAMVSGTNDSQVAALKALLEKVYPKAVKAIATGTPNQFKKDFDYDAAENVLRKSRTFFLAAAKAAGLPMSPHVANKAMIRSPKRSGAPARPRAAKSAPHLPASQGQGASVGSSAFPGLKQYPIPVGNSAGGISLWSIGVPEGGFQSEDVDTFIAVVKTALLKK